MKVTFDSLRKLRRHLIQRDVDLELLPPFAISPKDVFELRESRPVFLENINTQYSDSVFTVYGIKCVQVESLGMDQTGHGK